MSNVQVHNVGGWGHDPEELFVNHRVFEQLLNLTEDITVNYRQDLYEDAMWLQNHITNHPVAEPALDPEPTTFWYMTRQNGTHLTQSETWLDALVKTYPTAPLYTIAIVCTRGQWWMGVSQCQNH